MQAKRHQSENSIDELALCRLTPAAAVPAIVEASARRDRYCGPSWQMIGRRLAILGAKLLARLPPRNDREDYTAIASNAVTGVTTAWAAMTPSPKQ